MGSGPGTFLMIAKRRGWEVAGVEPAKLAAGTATSLGVETFNGVIEDFATTRPERYDVVVSFEVIEHVPEVLRMLMAIRSVLKPDGVCVSGAAHDAIAGKVAFAFTDLGEHQVKNIARPVKVRAR